MLYMENDAIDLRKGSKSVINPHYVDKGAVFPLELFNLGDMDNSSPASSERILLEPYKYLLQLPGESPPGPTSRPDLQARPGNGVGAALATPTSSLISVSRVTVTVPPVPPLILLTFTCRSGNLLKWP